MKTFLIGFCLVVIPCLALPTENQNIEIPFNSCQIDTTSRDECIKSSIQNILPKLQDGTIIQSIDPYTINERTFEYKRGELYTKLNLKTGNVHGISKTEIKDVRTKIDDNGLYAEIDVFVPRILAEGLYKSNGKFNSFKINAKGSYDITIIDTAATLKIKGVFVTKNGQQYLRIVNFDITPVIGDFKVNITGISPDPEINRLHLDFINHYWPLLYRDAVPQTKEVWEPHVISRINAVLLRVPFKTILFYGKEN